MFDTGYNGFTSVGKFRILSWYHIVYQGNSDTSTLADINKVYVNGNLATNVNSRNTFVPQDTVTNILKNGQVTRVGWDEDNVAYYFDEHYGRNARYRWKCGCHTEFGKTKDGIWIPKEYTGRHGTNGFHLAFSQTKDAGFSLTKWQMKSIYHTTCVLFRNPYSVFRFGQILLMALPACISGI